MKNTEYLSKEQRLKDYTTVANFLMSGDSKEVKEFAEQLNWGKFTEDCCEFMDIKFIRKYKDYIYWGDIWADRECSEDFIREFIDYADWYYISLYQNLSEDFIREFADEVDWYLISKTQTLSEDFIREFADEVDWESLIDRYNFSAEFRTEFKEYLEKTE